MVNFCKCCDAHMFFVVYEVIEAVSKVKKIMISVYFN